MHQDARGKLCMRTVRRMQAAQNQTVQPAEVPERHGNLRAAQDRAVTPPAQQGMQQQPVEVVALGTPALQRIHEPTMGYPNNVAYPGQEVDMTDERMREILDIVMMKYFGRSR